MANKYFDTIMKRYNSGRYRNYRIICFEKKLFLGKKSAGINPPKRDYRTEAINRAKRMIKDKIRNNFNAKFKFVTLTYREKEYDRDKVNLDLKELADHIREFYTDYKYVAVPEKHKDGSWHIHMIAEIPYIPNGKNVKQRRDGWTWGNLWKGFVKVNLIKNLEGAIFYMLKYVFKQLENADRYQHVYIISRNWNYDYESEHWIREDMTEIKTIVHEIEKQIGQKAFISQINSEETGNILIFDFYQKQEEKNGA